MNLCQFNVILDLCFSIGAAVLTEWVDVDDVGRLDSALCERERREQFLSILQADSFLLATLCDSKNLSLVFEWHIKRSAKVKAIHISTHIAGVAASVIVEFFRTVGSHHVTYVELDDVSGDTFVLFTALTFSCCNVSTYKLNLCLNWSGLTALGWKEQSRIKSLTIKHCRNSCKIDFTHFRLPNLKTLSLHGEYPSALVRDFLLAAPSLRHLYLNSVQLHDADLLTYCKRDNQLETLYFYSCHHIRAPAATELALKCATLTRLCIASCQNLADEVITDFATCCPLLECIRIQGRRITEHALSAIAEHSCQRLTILEANRFICASDQGILDIAAFCSLLTVLKLSEFTGVSMAGLARAFTAMPGLIGVGLLKCVISDEVLAAIAGSCRGLDTISLFKATGYTADVGVLALVQGCVHLQTVSVEPENVILTPLVTQMWRMVRPKLQVVFSEVDLYE